MVRKLLYLLCCWLLTSCYSSSNLTKKGFDHYTFPNSRLEISIPKRWREVEDVGLPEGRGLSFENKVGLNKNEIMIIQPGISDSLESYFNWWKSKPGVEEVNNNIKEVVFLENLGEYNKRNQLYQFITFKCIPGSKHMVVASFRVIVNKSKEPYFRESFKLVLNSFRQGHTPQ